MLIDYANPISKVTARDLLTGYLAGIDEAPTLDGALRIAEEFRARGAFVRQEYLFNVWAEVWEANRNDHKKSTGTSSGFNAGHAGAYFARPRRIPA